MADPSTTDEEKNNKGKDDSRWIDENVKMNHLYVISIEKDGAKDGAGKREHQKNCAQHSGHATQQLPGKEASNSLYVSRVEFW